MQQSVPVPGRSRQAAQAVSGRTSRGPGRDSPSPRDSHTGAWIFYPPSSERRRLIAPHILSSFHRPLLWMSPPGRAAMPGEGRGRLTLQMDPAGSGTA
ncbi:hypothetical protein EYF80_043658 [Liparis tanakae]|uniref:Uncharacterized protein n=1 Tax=Liparis tanakae TaxID=230148 RepID=A0A4Z2FZU2_9TELE|nr:hypothetical protein EYF80_043658 [Liparis tanakae]